MSENSKKKQKEMIEGINSEGLDYWLQNYYSSSDIDDEQLKENVSHYFKVREQIVQYFQMIAEDNDLDFCE